jgi:hypothetical protein
MASRYTLVVFLAGAAFSAASCRSTNPGHGPDYEMEICVPPDALAVAGLHLDQIRGSNFYRNLPPGWLALLEPLRDANYLMLAYNDNGVLAIAHGRFAAAPAGAVLLTPDLVLAGSPDAIRDAVRQRATGQPGAPSLLARSQPIAGRPIWVVARGGKPLPLTGNAANLNRLLRFTDYATIAATVNSTIESEAAGFCPTADAARQLEETLRGLISLATATTHDRDLVALMRSVQLRREDATVHLSLSASASALEGLLR